MHMRELTSNPVFSIFPSRFLISLIRTSLKNSSEFRGNSVRDVCAVRKERANSIDLPNISYEVAPVVPFGL